MGEINLALLVIGAFIGATFTYFVRVKLLAVEDFTKRFDEVCQDIREAADIGTHYWLQDGSSEELALLEAKILGYNWRINTLISYLTKSTWYLKDACEAEFADFSDSLSGGDFQVKGRAADPERSIQVQKAAAELVVNLRSQRRVILTWQQR